MMLDAQKAGKSGGIEVRFLEQTRIRDFLDVSPVGHWLRRTHLGIDSDLISVPLLKELCVTNMSQYESDITLLEHQFLVETQSEVRVANDLLNPSYRLHFLVGESGVGKSTAALRQLKRHTTSNEPGLWISAETLERATSLANALELTLKSLLPSLRVGTGHDILNQLGDFGSLLLVFDDVNRSNSPINLVRKIIGWIRPLDDKDGSNPLRNVRVLCPLWQTHWTSLQLSLESSGWIRQVTVTPFTRSESLATLRHALPTRTEYDLTQFALALHDDPILIGLFNASFAGRASEASLLACSNVMGNFMQARLSEIASALHEPTALIESALKKLALKFVETRELRPPWSVVEDWFVSDRDVIRLLRQLASDGHLARIVDRDGSLQWEFRHDRLLGHYVVGAIATLLRGRDSDQLRAAFDPYFVPFLAQAIASVPLDDMLLSVIRRSRPAALAGALRFIREESEDNPIALVEVASDWLSNGNKRTAEWYDSVRLLEEVPTPFTLKLTSSRKNDPMFWHARFRNGDVLSGACILMRDFYPRTNFPFLENMVANSIAMSRRRFVADLRSLLTSESLTSDLREGLLLLAGYLGEPDLIPEIIGLWTSSRAEGKERKDLLLCDLWATLRSARPADMKSSLGVLVLAVNSLNAETGEKTHISERASMLSEISHAGRHGYPMPVLEFLAEAAHSEELRWTVIQILEHVDHPVAITCMIRVLGKMHDQAQKSGIFNHYTSTWRENWDGSRGRASLGLQSLARIRELWEDTTEAPPTRSYAFLLWSRLNPDIDSLRAVSSNDPYFSTAVWKRVEMGDRSATEIYLKFLDEKPFWVRGLAHIWSPALRPVLAARLRLLHSNGEGVDSNSDHELSGILRDIPGNDSESLLLEHWSFLGKRHQFIQVALYVATEKTRKLASQALQEWTSEKDPFEFVDHTFGFFTYGLSDRLTVKHMEILLPYVDLLKPRILEHMIESCGRAGFRAFAELHLLPRARRLLAVGSLTDEDDLRIMSHAICEWFPEDAEHFKALTDAARDSRWTASKLEHWIDKFGRRQQQLPNFTEFLSRWKREGNPDRLRVVATLIRYWGTRSDLAYLQQELESETHNTELNLRDIRYEVERRTPR